MKKFGTPIGAGPGSDSEKLGLRAVGTPLPVGSFGCGWWALVFPCPRGCANGSEDCGSERLGPSGTGGDCPLALLVLELVVEELVDDEEPVVELEELVELLELPVVEVDPELEVEVELVEVELEGVVVVVVNDGSGVEIVGVLLDELDELLELELDEELELHGLVGTSAGLTTTPAAANAAITCWTVGLDGNGMVVPP